MSNKKNSKRLQRATGMAYITCRRLVLGELIFQPQEHDCEIQAKLREIVKFIPAVSGARHVACRCKVCGAR